MTTDFVPWVDPHKVQVESEPVTLYRWWCETCEREESGYTHISDAERSADDHATNSPRPDGAS
jgi:hypothetical protein